MTPDDPRHGTTRGHNAGCRCAPCCAAKLAYDKRRRLDEVNGLTRRVPSWRVTRRIQALQALGWSLRAIADEAGFPHHNYCDPRANYVYASTFAVISATYERLSMQFPPTDTGDQRAKVSRTRNHARRHGFAPPLAWDDIDDPNEQPKGLGSDRKTTAARYDELLHLAHMGDNLETACAQLGLDRDTLWVWCKRTGNLDLYERLAERSREQGNQYTVGAA